MHSVVVRGINDHGSTGILCGISNTNVVKIYGVRNYRDGNVTLRGNGSTENTLSVLGGSSSGKSVAVLAYSEALELLCIKIQRKREVGRACSLPSITLVNGNLSVVVINLTLNAYNVGVRRILNASRSRVREGEYRLFGILINLGLKSSLVGLITVFVLGNGNDGSGNGRIDNVSYSGYLFCRSAGGLFAFTVVLTAGNYGENAQYR